jgi:hypothetical protein
MTISNTHTIFAILDNSGIFPDDITAARARDLTIAWSRFKYFGPIIEDTSIAGILCQAVASDADYCLIQAYGHILAEVWHSDDGESMEIMQAISEWIAQRDFLVTGHVLEKEGSSYSLEPDCLLINLKLYRELGCPVIDDAAGADLVRLSRENGIEVYNFPVSIDASLVRLDPGCPGFWNSEPGPDDMPLLAGDLQATDKQHLFVTGIRQLTGKLRKSIFVWNLESYEDIENPADGFEPPLTALYTVSAGFKPNRILQTHGFDANTRMVVFDYSPHGLEFRRLLHEQWDGLDYPSFLRVLFRKIPSTEAHYLLWDGMTPENLDWGLVDRRWQEELNAWGGEEALFEHWQKFRKINVEYLPCNILTEPDKLIDTIKDEQQALIWWSNAFFSVYSNWFYTTAQRQQLYRHWIEKLTQKAPRLLMYGSDCHNVSVNFYTTSEYMKWLQENIETGFNDLTPASLQRVEMRF